MATSHLVPFAEEIPRAAHLAKEAAPGSMVVQLQYNDGHRSSTQMESDKCQSTFLGGFGDGRSLPFLGATSVP